MEYAIIQKYTTDGYQIGQKDLDLGDGACRLGQYYVSLAALGVKQDDLGMNIESGFRYRVLVNSKGLEYGRFRRGYAPGRWFHNEFNVTRDQTVPMLAAAALTRSINFARAHFWHRAKRLFFHFSEQNDGADAGPLVRKMPDPPSPPEIGTLIRATRYKMLYWLLPLCDLWLYLDVKWGRSMSERSLYDSDGQVLPQLLAALDQPTFVTEFVRRAYATTDAPERLAAYFSEQNRRNGNEVLGTLMVTAFYRAVGGLEKEHTNVATK